MYKEIFQNKKAVIFDLDGTIVNTYPYWLQAFQNVLENNSLGWIEAKEYLILGETLTITLKKIIEQNELKLEKTNEEILKEVTTEYRKIIDELEELLPIDGFWDFIYALKEKGILVCLATNSSEGQAEKVLENLNVGKTFDAIIFGDQVKNKKPNPEIYNKLVKGLKLKKKEVLVFEDSEAGAQAAEKAGLDLCIIWNREIPMENYPNNTIFFEDFVGLDKSMDKTYREILEEFRNNHLNSPKLNN